MALNKVRRTILAFFSVQLLITGMPNFAPAAPQCATIFSRIGRSIEADARAAGLQVEFFPELYRYDSRSPKLVAKEGFQGNPDKPEGDILTHSGPGAKGTGSYVSLTRDKDSMHFLKGDLFIGVAYSSNKYPSNKSRNRYLKKFNPEYKADLKRRKEEAEELWVASMFKTHQTAEEARLEAELQTRFSNLSSELEWIDKSPIDPYVYVTYEYMVKEVRGVDTAAVGLVAEAEVVTNSVSPANIIAYREVYWILDGYLNGDRKDPQIIEWQKQNTEFQQLKWLLSHNKEALEIEFGAWKPLR
jgi:hypothetical protein